MSKKHTIEEIRKYLLQYSPTSKLLSDTYKNNSTPLLFRCGICQKEFTRTFVGIKKSKLKVCRNCWAKESNKNRTLTIQQIQEICEKHDYIFIDTFYNGISNKINIMDKENYKGKSTIGNIRKNKRFQRFSLLSNAENFSYNINNFIMRNGLDSKFIKVTGADGCGHILCLFQCKCGNTYITTIQRFMNKKKCRCEKCSKSISSYEYKVKKFLEYNNIYFLHHHWFDSCRTTNNRVCYFDFYLPNYNLAIEVDGEQHYKEVPRAHNKSASKELKDVIQRDNIKNMFCQEHKIGLIRIPYYLFSKDEYIKILKEVLQIH